ncbi:hypothetical protein SAMN04488592_3474, partial [Microbacterium azadirachtae]
MFNTKPKARAPARSRFPIAFPNTSNVVFPTVPTMIAPSALCANTAASVTGINGGASMITIASRAIDFNNSRIRADPNTSLGFGGTFPAVTTNNCPLPNRCATSAIVARPASTSEIPAPFGKPNTVSTIGRRRSPSINTTGCPLDANVTARFDEIVDFPSPGNGLVTTMIRGGLSTSMYCRFVRNSRIASPIPNRCAPSLPRLVPPSNGNNRLSAVNVFSSGIVPTTGLPVSRSTCSTERIRRSNVYRNRPYPTATAKPTNAPNANANRVFGDDGASGKRAES